MPLYEEERAIVAKVRTNEEIKGELAREVDLAIAKAFVGRRSGTGCQRPRHKHRWWRRPWASCAESVEENGTTLHARFTTSKNYSASTNG